VAETTGIYELPKLDNPTIGTEFEINGNCGVIVGVAKVPASGLFGIPTLYTTFSRAVQVIPSMRYTISYVLAEPASTSAIPHIKQEIAKLGYEALTEGRRQELTGSARRGHDDGKVAAGG
jgi:putative ABC transport system permease protein